MRIKDAEQLQITIERENSDKNHELNIIRCGNKIKVWCSTPDNEQGKEFYIEIYKGEEYSIGRANTLILERDKAKLEKLEEKIKKVRSAYNHHKSISTVSIETEKASDKLKDLNKEAEILSLRIAKFESDPRLKWFDKDESSDIDQDQIILEFTEEGIIVVTDDGEKGKSTLTRWK